MISVVMSAFNASATIERAINSVIAQSYKDWELIVVNDCSTDNTEDIVKRLQAGDERIKLISLPTNQGAGVARGTGLKQIKGDYTLFVDSDDELCPDAMETLLKYAEEYDADMVQMGYAALVNGELETIRMSNLRIDEGEDRLLPNNTCKQFLNPTLIKAHLWDKVEYSTRRYIEDTPTAARLVWYANKYVSIPYVGYKYHQLETSLIHSASELKTKIYLALCAKSNLEFFEDKEYSHPEVFEEMMQEKLNDVKECLSATTENIEVYKNELTELGLLM